MTRNVQALIACMNLKPNFLRLTTCTKDPTALCNRLSVCGRRVIFKQHTSKFCNRRYRLPRKQMHQGLPHHTAGLHTTSNMNGSQEILTDIFKNSLNSVMPRNMICNKLSYDSETSVLKVEDKKYKLNNNLYIVGFGKAVLGMASIVEDILMEHIVTGIISIPIGLQEKMSQADKCDMLLTADSKIKIYEGARNNIPDKDSQRAATEIQNLVTSLRENDILLVLISGGGSALLPTPMDPITLEEEAELTKRISASGATIGELNCIRKHIETLKGGGLAEHAFPAKVVSLILSDAIGDDLDIIASGPTVRDTSSPHQCLHILQSLGLTIPRSITMTVEKAAASLKSSNDMNTILQNVQNVLLGNNKLVTDGASIKATESNFVSFVLTNTLDGEARKCGEVFGKLAKYLCLSFELAFQRSNRSSSELSTLEIELVQSGLIKATLNELVYVVNKAYNKKKDICIISGGETTVAVKGDGKGGRNQELALATAIELDKLFSDSDLAAQFSVSFLSGGTDGQDGPTDAAGAVIDNAFVETCLSEKYDPVQYLHNNDSYNLFSNVSSGKHLLKIGLTGTNVMDIQLLAIRKRK